MSTTQHPLTETDAVEMSMKFAPSVAFQMVASVAPDDLTEYARAAFDAGREHERANPDDALRAAREQGWDEAVAWGHDRNPRLINKHGNLAAEWLAANPHRPAPTLPTTDGAVIVPAEGREFIEAEVAGQTYIAREAVVCRSDFGPANVLEGAWRRADTGARVGGQVSRDFITPGTWKVEGE